MSPASRWRALTARARPRWLTDDVLTGARWGLTTLWVLGLAWQWRVGGLPIYRSDLLIWLVLLLAARSVGRRGLATIVIDFLPFAAVLIAYDYLRGVSDTLGMPTWWHPQIDVDRFLFAGHEPTVWLQEHLKQAEPRWWDAVVALCYFSFFFLPYVTAAVMWWRSRTDFYRWAGRFVTLSFVGFAFFALIPSAPPWAAARCEPSEVATHPHGPACLGLDHRTDNGLLGPFTTFQGNAVPWIERISTRGLSELHLHFAGQLVRAGQGGADLVAAVPSLHLGGTMLFCLFLWRRVRWWWRPLLVAYPLLMTFSLTYSAEHYVSDCLAGALLAVLVHLAAGRVEARLRIGGRYAGTPPDRSLEPSCPPPRPPLATTPSSTSASAADSSSPPARSTAAPAPPGTTAPSASS